MSDRPAPYTPSQRAILASQLDQADTQAASWPEDAVRVAEAYWRQQCRILLAQAAAAAERAAGPPPAMSEPEWRHFTRLLVEAGTNASTDWEEQFVDDMDERRERWGRNIELTKEQWAKLEEIAEGRKPWSA